MQTRKTEILPNEFMARWDDAGKLKGAHIIFLGKVLDDAGNPIAAQPMPPQPVAIGVREGFPLGEILEQIQITALEKVESLTQELEAERQLTQQLQAQIAEMQKERGL